MFALLVIMLEEKVLWINVSFSSSCLFSHLDDSDTIVLIRFASLKGMLNLFVFRVT